MPTIPLWLVGKSGGYIVTLTPLSINGTTGAITASTPVQTITTDVDEIDIENNPQLEEISALTSPRQHNIVLQDGARMVFTEILKGAGSNKLATLQYGADYILASVTRGGQEWEGYFCRGQYRESLRKGKSVGVLSLEPCDPGQVQVAYA